MERFTVVASPEVPGLLLLGGELDMETAPELDHAFASLSGDVVVDCSRLRFIDTSGFYALDRGHAAAVARDATFRVEGFNPFQERLARLLRLPYVAASGAAA